MLHAMNTNRGRLGVGRYVAITALAGLVVLLSAGCGAKPENAPGTPTKTEAAPAPQPTGPEAEVQKEASVQFEFGKAAMEEREFDKAIEQFNAVIDTIDKNKDLLQSPDQMAMIGRYFLGTAYQAKGDHTDALQEFGKASGLTVMAAPLYLSWGLSQLCTASYEDAEKSFRRAIELGEDNAVKANGQIGLFLAQARAGKDGKAELAEFAKTAGDAGSTPTIRMLLGEMTPEEYIKAAADDEKGSASAFVGEFFLIAGDVEQAKSYFQKALDAPQFQVPGGIIAEAELARLAAPPAPEATPAEPTTPAEPAAPATTSTEPAAAPVP